MGWWMCEVWVGMAGLDSFGWDGEVSYFNAIEIKVPKTKPEDGCVARFLFFFFYCPFGIPPPFVCLGLGLFNFYYAIGEW